ncbi:MAG: galactokinase [Gemmatimonadaceae bacterium]|nr:galactokinase [Gemmatimonadaceae bacterium]
MTWRYRVPGRVELAGKHTDYAGGPSLTCATPFHMHAKAHAIPERRLRVYDQRSKTTMDVPLAPDAAPAGPRSSVYVAAVARRIARDFSSARTGVAFSLGSTIPTSMGMSSSSALVITLALGVFDANALWSAAEWAPVTDDPLAFAQYCAAMESGAPWGPFAGDTGVGTRGGAQDHIAICASEERAVGMYAYLPGRVLRRVPWPDSWRIVVATSGVKATKTGNAMGAYNRVADSVRALVDVWNADTGRSDATLGEVMNAAPDAYDHLRTLVPRAVRAEISADYLSARVQQYREETAVIVPGMAEAIARVDAPAMAELMQRSQEMAEHALQNQVPQTVWLAQHARECGAVAATAFGAGFGGAVWALADAAEEERVAERWMQAYRDASGFAGGHHESARVMVPAAGMWRSA